MTEDKLKEHFSKKGNITDVQLKYTKEGVFRRFCFIGYKTEEEAQNAVDYFNQTYIDTSKISVELCAKLGKKLFNFLCLLLLFLFLLILFLFLLLLLLFLLCYYLSYCYYFFLMIQKTYEIFLWTYLVYILIIYPSVNSLNYYQLIIYLINRF